MNPEGKPTLVLQNHENQPLHGTMNKKEHPAAVTRRVGNHRARLAASGMVPVTAYIPAELVEEIDRLKADRGASSRAPVIAEAMRFYIENMRA